VQEGDEREAIERESDEREGDEGDEREAGGEAVEREGGSMSARDECPTCGEIAVGLDLMRWRCLPAPDAHRLPLSLVTSASSRVRETLVSRRSIAPAQ
jgi:hypothetical protein